MRSLVLVAFLSCCALDVFGGEELVDFKPDETTLWIQVPKTWKENPRPKRGTYSFLFERTDDYTPMFTFTIVPFPGTLEEFVKWRRDSAGKNEITTTGTFTTDRGEKGITAFLSGTHPRTGDKIRQTLYCLSWGPDEILMFDAIFLEKNADTLGATMQKVATSVRKNPEGPPPLKPGERYVSKRGRASIVAPPYLQFFNAPPEEFKKALEMGVRLGDKRYSRSLIILRVQNRANVEEWYKEQINPALGAEILGEKVSDSPFVTNSGLKGIRYESKHKVEGGPTVTLVQYFLGEGPRIYNLYFKAAEENIATSRVDFDTSAKSFRLEGP